MLYFYNSNLYLLYLTLKRKGYKKNYEDNNNIVIIFDIDKL